MAEDSPNLVTLALSTLFAKHDFIVALPSNHHQ
jgi:hypothetical protein